VANACGGAGGGGGTGGGTKTVVYHYDVTLVGHVKDTTVYTGNAAADLNGTLMLDLDWRGAFDNIAVEKVTTGDVFVIAMNKGLFGSGSVSGTHHFTETRERFGGMCSGIVEITATPARIAVGGSRVTGVTEFVLAAQMLDDPSASWWKTINAKHEQSCDGFGKGDPHFPFEEFVVQEVTVSPFVLLLEMDAKRRDESGAMWPPLNRLVNGDAFTIDTGLVKRPVTDCGDDCTGEREGRLAITFTPRR
jgi:hypothetical protein